MFAVLIAGKSSWHIFLLKLAGIIGGKFLERGRVKKPDQPGFSTKLSEYYLAPDLFVGAQVEFNNHKFVLIDADEYAYNYMERNAERDGVRKWLYSSQCLCCYCIYMSKQVVTYTS